VLGFVLSIGCSEEPPDELSEPILTAIAESRGDAIGYGYSGVYEFATEVARCDCPESEDLMGIGSSSPDFCRFDPFAGGNRFRLVQADGVLMLENSLGILTGPLQQSGEFSLAGVFHLESAVSSGARATRCDGSFMGDPSVGSDQPLTLSAVSRTRTDLDIGFPEATSIECESTVSIAGTWVAP
jgi:hypothetical protein